MLVVAQPCSQGNWVPWGAKADAEKRVCHGRAWRAGAGTDPILATLVRWERPGWARETRQVKRQILVKEVFRSWATSRATATWIRLGSSAAEVPVWPVLFRAPSPEAWPGRVPAPRVARSWMEKEVVSPCRSRCWPPRRRAAGAGPMFGVGEEES